MVFYKIYNFFLSFINIGPSQRVWIFLKTVSNIKSIVNTTKRLYNSYDSYDTNVWWFLCEYYFIACFIIKMNRLKHKAINSYLQYTKIYFSVWASVFTLKRVLLFYDIIKYIINKSSKQNPRLPRGTYFIFIRAYLFIIYTWFAHITHKHYIIVKPIQSIFTYRYCVLWPRLIRRFYLLPNIYAVLILIVIFSSGITFKKGNFYRILQNEI